MLTDLDLCSNSLGSVGGIAMAEALKVNGVLTSLDVSDNGLDAEAGQALAKAREVKGVLKTLYISPVSTLFC